MQTPLIELKKVTKCFYGQTVLDRINLRIHQGEITTIIGKSGTGKSVLLRLIVGLMTPESGVILYQNRDVHKMGKKMKSEYDKQFGFLFQNNALFDSLSVFDNIALPLRQTSGLSSAEIENRVIDLMQRADIEDASNRYPAELSGGMQKRVALARALATEPRIILLDEPTTGQDPVRKKAILDMINAFLKQKHSTAIMVSHDIPDIFCVSDRILLLDAGRIVFQDTPEELIFCGHPFVNAARYRWRFHERINKRKREGVTLDAASWAS